MTALAKTDRKSQIRAWLQSDKFRAQITEALPSVCTPDRFLRVLFTQMQKVPKLMECTQASLFSALITCSSLGIEPDGRRAHLIPFDNKMKRTTECQLIIDYKGLLELVKRSGDVVSVHADKVCDNDKFRWENGDVRHEIDFRRPRGKAYAYYARAVLKDGCVQAEVMTLDEVNAIRAISKGAKKADSPWEKHFDEMAKKTVFRRLTKWLVLSPEIADQIESADRTEFPALGADAVPAALDAPPADKKGSSLLEAIDRDDGEEEGDGEPAQPDDDGGEEPPPSEAPKEKSVVKKNLTTVSAPVLAAAESAVVKENFTTDDSAAQPDKAKDSREFIEREREKAIAAARANRSNSEFEIF